MSSYALSDVHGCYQTLKELCDNKLKLSAIDKLFVLGDHIDNGPASRQVLDYFDELRGRIKELVLLRGNHEQRMLLAYQQLTNETKTTWLNNGGHESLMSFEVEKVEEVPSCYLNMIDRMGYFHIEDGYIMVHAGFNFSSDRPFADSIEMLEIRDWQYDERQTEGKTILHGHTPTSFYEIKRNVEMGAHAICLDSGCCKKGEGLGGLTALELSTKKLYWQECIDD